MWRFFLLPILESSLADLLGPRAISLVCEGLVLALWRGGAELDLTLLSLSLPLLRFRLVARRSTSLRVADCWRLISYHAYEYGLRKNGNLEQPETNPKTTLGFAVETAVATA